MSLTCMLDEFIFLTSTSYLVILTCQLTKFDLIIVILDHIIMTIFIIMTFFKSQN